MRNSKAVYSEIISGIHINEDLEEKSAIASLLMDNIFRLSQSEVLTGKPVNWTPDLEAKLDNFLKRINNGEPVQYVTGEAHFFGERFLVDENVLIPRPETEELVDVIIQFVQSLKNPMVRIADIGTGSGCIAISLARKIAAEVFATDVSVKAMSVARVNSEKHQVKVTFLQHDILKDKLPVNRIDVLVSNPPYIAKSEIAGMKENVTRFEPHLALFVPDEDPLLFYGKIASEGRRILNSNGMIAFEINERFADDVATLLEEAGFMNAKILKDLSGKERFVKAFQP